MEKIVNKVDASNQIHKKFTFLLPIVTVKISSWALKKPEIKNDVEKITLFKVVYIIMYRKKEIN